MVRSSAVRGRWRLSRNVSPSARTDAGDVPRGTRHAPFGARGGKRVAPVLAPVGSWASATAPLRVRASDPRETVLSLLRRRAVARAAAIAVALATSGLARAVPPFPVGSHHCRCSAHGEDHVCACPVCAAAARRARLAHIEDLPPCHRAAARAALAASDAQRGRDPCVLPTCGAPWESAASPQTEPFPVPAASALARAAWCAPLEWSAAAAPDVPSVPEVPPPRR